MAWQPDSLQSSTSEKGDRAASCSRRCAHSARLGPSCPSLPAGPLQRRQAMSLRLWRLSQAWRMLKKLMIWGCAAAAWLVKRPSIFCVRRSCSKRRAHRANRATRRVHEANLGQARAHGQIGLSARSTGEHCLRCGPLGEILGVR